MAKQAWALPPSSCCQPVRAPHTQGTLREAEGPPGRRAIGSPADG